MFLVPSDTQSDPDFCIVARVEAFIAGWGLDEALKRSEAYLNAGADAILMHSKKSDPSDIKAFVKAWNNQVHVIGHKNIHTSPMEGIVFNTPSPL